jgi:hypothetical protein
MQNSQLDRLLKLAKRTGDRLIVTSNDGAEPVVILPLAEYEGMLDAMTFFRSQEGGEDTDNEGGFTPDVIVPDHRRTPEPEEEGDFDPVALERQVMAAMAQEEPEVVPVETSGETQETPVVPAETPRKPITRKPNPVEDGGEERFYLEPV